MFLASKLLAFLTSPANLAFFLLAVGTILLWTRWRRAGRRIVLFVTLLLGAVLTMPVADWVASPLEDRFRAASVLPEEVHGIVVLAGGTRPDMSAALGQPSLDEAADRFVIFAMLARRFPEARLVFAGGNSRIRGGVAAATEVAHLFTGLGLPTERFLFEGGSRTTYESALALSTMLSIGPEENWLLITSAQHMPRSIGVFRKAGLAMRPYQVDYRIDPTRKRYLRLTLANELNALESPLHEWSGLLAYWLAGYTTSLFPGP